MGKFKPFFDIDIDERYSPEERKSIATEVIDFVISRTESGLDKDNNGFAKYSKSYAKEKGQTNVDLTFSGEMLSELSLLREKSGSIRIGYDSEYDGMGKLEGNILSTYGNDKPVTKPRNFLGITKKDLDNILDSYDLNDKESLDESVANEIAADIVATRIAKKSKVESDRDE